MTWPALVYSLSLYAPRYSPNTSSCADISSEGEGGGGGVRERGEEGRDKRERGEREGERRKEGRERGGEG